jgi:hypothetical protein
LYSVYSVLFLLCNASSVDFMIVCVLVNK